MTKSEGFRAAYARGIRTSIRNNSRAFGYSVVATTTFAALSIIEGSVRLGELFLFVAGVGIAFAAVEAVVSGFFTKRLGEEPSEVVILGSALSLFSMTAALGSGASVALFTGSWVAWLASPAVATSVYLGATGLELALAERAEARGHHGRR